MAQNAGHVRFGDNCCTLRQRLAVPEKQLSLNCAISPTAIFRPHGDSPDSEAPE